MAVANLHTPQRNHADRIGCFAMDTIRAAQATLVDIDDPQRGCINLRVGFHTGSVVANVIGTKNPRCALHPLSQTDGGTDCNFADSLSSALSYFS